MIRRRSQEAKKNEFSKGRKLEKLTNDSGPGRPHEIVTLKYAALLNVNQEIWNLKIS